MDQHEQELSARGLAHELSQPLTAIMGFAGACLYDSAEGLTESHADNLRRIIKQTERAAQILRERHALAQTDEPVLTITAEAQQRSVEMETQPVNRPAPVLADVLQIEQVVLILARYAIEAMAGLDQVEPRLTIEASNVSGHEVDVSHPFYATKPACRRLGLAIARRIVEAHDGRIWVTPSTDGGSTFHFMLRSAERQLSVQGGFQQPVHRAQADDFMQPLDGPFT